MLNYDWISNIGKSYPDDDKLYNLYEDFWKELNFEMKTNNSTRITVFYAGMVYGEYSKAPKQKDVPDEVYQGGIMYFHFNDPNSRHWWRMDRTPMLDEDVPPELKVWVLIL